MNTPKLLVEKSQTAKLVLEKKNLPNPPPLRVGVAFDGSGSMHSRYHSGMVQATFDQLMGAALKLDDNGELDAWVFDTRAEKIATAKPEDYGTFVTHKILRAGKFRGGGTNYEPAMRLIRDEMFGGSAPTGGLLGGLFGKKQAVAPTDPTLIFFMTDGDNADRGPTDQLLKETAGLPIYWNMVGIGSDTRFPFLTQMADKYDHVGFVHLSELNLTDQQMYEKLFTDEFVAWVKKLKTT